jgi:HSP20 family protein
MNKSMIPWTNRIPINLDEVRRDFDQVLSGWFNEGGNDGLQKFFPQTNVVETEKQYEITMDLPGMKPEEVKVELQNDHLIISGERKQEKEERGKIFHRIERSHGSFRRVLPMQIPVNSGGIEAKYQEGVLKIVAPKAESAVAQKIEVKG